MKTRAYGSRFSPRYPDNRLVRLVQAAVNKTAAAFRPARPAPVAERIPVTLTEAPVVHILPRGNRSHDQPVVIQTQSAHVPMRWQGRPGR